MVVGISTFTNSKDFGIALLAPLAQGETIWATDTGWRIDATFHTFWDNSHDFYVMHTAATEEAAGTVLTLQNFSYEGQSASLTVATEDDFMKGLRTGDQLIVYRGTEASPTVLCALDSTTDAPQQAGSCPANSPRGWQTNVSNPCFGHAYSALPPGLTRGVDALEWPFAESWGYAGPTYGSASQLRAAIAQISNWDESNSVLQAWPSQFDVKPEPPMQPTATATGTAATGATTAPSPSTALAATALATATLASVTATALATAALATAMSTALAAAALSTAALTSASVASVAAASPSASPSAAALTAAAKERAASEQRYRARVGAATNQDRARRAACPPFAGTRRAQARLLNRCL